jgi:hypothetical protein
VSFRTACVGLNVSFAALNAATRTAAATGPKWRKPWAAALVPPLLSLVPLPIGSATKETAMNPSLRMAVAFSALFGLANCGTEMDAPLAVDPSRAAPGTGSMATMVATMSPGMMQAPTPASPDAGPSVGAPPTPPPGDPAQRFVGAWTAVSGTHTAQCEDDPPESKSIVPYSRRIARSLDGALTFTGSCPDPIKLDVLGDTATARANQSCAGYISGTDIRVVVTVITSAMTTADGQQMTFSHQETRTAGNSTGSVICRIKQEGVLARAP